MVDGTIIDKGFNTARGYYIIMKETSSGQAFLYQHMREGTPLNIGDTIKQGQYVGHEGATGDVTGIHLHLEQQDLSSGRVWNFSIASLEPYENPADFMGIPNVEGISAIYDGTPIPPTPVRPRKSKFPWVLYTKKLRRKIHIEQ